MSNLMNKSIPIWLQATAGLLIGLLAVIGYSLVTRPHSFSGTVLETPKAAYDFSLTGPNDQKVHLSDSSGKMRVIFFGYTSCPDVCPTTLADLSRVLKLMGGKADQVQVLFISVDPEKDTPQRINEYLKQFDTRMIGLSGTLEDITTTAKEYNIYFEKKPFGDQGGYTVDHTAVIFLIDQVGNTRIIFPYGTQPPDIASDISYLLGK
jgi:protein SCO1